MKMSKHVTTDRMNRMLYIAQYVGWGTPVLEVVMPATNNRYCLTDTGVILVKDVEQEFVITAFVGNMDKVVLMYRTAGYEHVPNRMYQKVVKNKIHVIKQNQYKGA